MHNFKGEKSYNFKEREEKLAIFSRFVTFLLIYNLIVLIYNLIVLKIYLLYRI